MLHARKDYQRIQDPENKIGKNEPVFIVRAKDKFSLITMQAWADAVSEEADRLTDTEPEKAKALEEMSYLVRCHLEKARSWQMKHGYKLPDMPNQS